MDTEKKHIYTSYVSIVGTGNSISSDNEGLPTVNMSTYFDSVLMSDQFVWHVFIS